MSKKNSKTPVCSIESFLSERDAAVYSVLEKLCLLPALRPTKGIQGVAFVIPTAETLKTIKNKMSGGDDEVDMEEAAYIARSHILFGSQVLSPATLLSKGVVVNALKNKFDVSGSDNELKLSFDGKTMTIKPNKEFKAFSNSRDYKAKIMVYDAVAGTVSTAEKEKLSGQEYHSLVSGGDVAAFSEKTSFQKTPDSIIEKDLAMYEAEIEKNLQKHSPFAERVLSFFNWAIKNDVKDKSVWKLFKPMPEDSYFSLMSYFNCAKGSKHFTDWAKTGTGLAGVSTENIHAEYSSQYNKLCSQLGFKKIDNEEQREQLLEYKDPSKQFDMLRDIYGNKLHEFIGDLFTVVADQTLQEIVSSELDGDYKQALAQTRNLHTFYKTYTAYCEKDFDSIKEILIGQTDVKYSTLHKFIVSDMKNYTPGCVDNHEDVEFLSESNRVSYEYVSLIAAHSKLESQRPAVPSQD